MNIGIIGCGSIATAHINALRKLKHVNDIYVFDVDYAKATEFANRFAGTIAGVELKNVITNVDGAIITTPNNTHLNVLKDILLIKQVPVLCEKPLSSSLADAIEFNKLAPPFSCIGLNYRFNRIINEILITKDTKNLGDFIFIDIAFNKNSAFTKKDITWRDTIEQENSSGAFGDLSSHLFDLVHYMTKSPINKQTLKVSKGTKVSSRKGIKLSNDDHSVSTGLTDNGTCFRVKSTKSALDEDLGFHMNLTLEHGELLYSSSNSNTIKIRYTDKIETDTVQINYPKVIEDPQKEIPYWADSFYFQNKLWIEMISKGETSEIIANITDGLNIQNLISSI